MEQISSKSKRKEMLRSLSLASRLSLLSSESKLLKKQQAESLRISTEGVALFFDLSYTSAMSQSETNSMINQIRFSIGFLRKQTSQFFKLTCCNASENIRKILESKGSQNWRLEIHSEDVKDLVKQETHVIFLSPDADEVLGEIDLNHSVYVIGGLVDRTVKANETLNRARLIGVRSMRLPIKEEIGEFTSPSRLKKVLNMNTVVEVLHHRAAGDTWKEAFLKCIPKRWLIV